MQHCCYMYESSFLVFNRNHRPVPRDGAARRFQSYWSSRCWRIWVPMPPKAPMHRLPLPAWCLRKRDLGRELAAPLQRHEQEKNCARPSTGVPPSSRLDRFCPAPHGLPREVPPVPPAVTPPLVLYLLQAISILPRLGGA